MVASAASLLPRVSAPERLDQTAITLTPGQDISPTDLGDLLAAAGYTRQDPVDESGEFCVRGGVVDFFPAGAGEPIRLEFVGDTIESIRGYDPSTQRSTAGLDQAAVTPLQELLGDQDSTDRSATAFDYLWSERQADGARVRARGRRGTRREADPADPGELRRSRGKGQPGSTARRVGRAVGRGRQVARRSDRSRDTGAR